MEVEAAAARQRAVSVGALGTDEAEKAEVKEAGGRSRQRWRTLMGGRGELAEEAGGQEDRRDGHVSERRRRVGGRLGVRRS